MKNRKRSGKKALLDAAPPEIMKYWRRLAKRHDGFINVRRIPRNGFLVYLHADRYIDLGWASLYSKLTHFFINGRSYDEDVALKMLKLKAFW